MATSGSVTYNQTRNELIHDAYQLIGVYGVGRTISAEDMTFASNMLNKMIKSWQADGLHLWSKEEGVLFPTDNVGIYTLGSAATAARATKWSDANITQLNGAHAVSATSLTVDDTTGMAASDVIGIVLDDESITWTTIVSVDSSTTLTITAGLDSAAADNRNVYTFTNRITKPLRIHEMRRRLGVTQGSVSATEIPMLELSHQDFFNLPNQDLNGVTTHFYYNPDLNDGTLYLWPRPDSPNYQFRFTYERPLEDVTSAEDNLDFPSEWLEAITYQLAYRLAPAFGKDKGLLQPEASALLQKVRDWDTETTSIQIVPGRR